MEKNSRRTFIKYTGGIGAALGFPVIIPSSVLGNGNRPAPSNRLTLGCIGTGNNGLNWMRNFLKDPRVELLAVCDVNKKSGGYWNGSEGGSDIALQMYREHVAATTGKPVESIADIDVYTDFRKLLARDDIDAVQIATPDHWHALQVIAAAKAKKHIYGQKPLSLTVHEGRLMADAVKKASVTFQTGSQHRSSAHTRKAIEFVRNGFIGKVSHIEVGLPEWHPDYSKQGSQKEEQPVPKGLDYDMWLGPAPEAYYCPARLPVNWRWILDYSGGQITDFGAHFIDVVQWAMGKEKTGPVRFTDLSGRFPDKKELYNTATEYRWTSTYADGLVMKAGTKLNRGVRFFGEDGQWVHWKPWHVETHPIDVMKSRITDDMNRVFVSNDHVKNFIDCVFSGDEPIAPIEDAHRTISVAHLANISMQLKRDELIWDPATESIKNDETASKMLTREYRAPWKLG